jgi:hypothetical protein
MRQRKLARQHGVPVGELGVRAGTVLAVHREDVVPAEQHELGRIRLGLQPAQAAHEALGLPLAGRWQILARTISLILAGLLSVLPASNAFCAPQVPFELRNDPCFDLLLDGEFSAELQSALADDEINISKAIVRSKPLSPAEQRFLSVYTLGGESKELFFTLEEAARFYAELGRLPVDGVELVRASNYVRKLRSRNKQAPQFSQLQQAGELKLNDYPYLFHAINPATGKVINSFNSEGEPFAIKLIPTGKSKNDYVEVVPPRGTPFLRPAAFDEWRIVLTGEQGQVLCDFTTESLRTISEEDNHD